MIRVIIFDWGDTLMRDFPDMQGAMCSWPTLELVDGVGEALGPLDPSLIFCVASNAGASDAERMGQALERVGIRHHFRHLFTSKELGTSKPAVGSFQEAARRAGAAPAECAMVGNDLEKDIAGARRTGMQTIWLSGGPVSVTSPDAGAESGAGAGAVADPTGPATVAIASMSQLPAAVRLLASHT